MSETPSDAAANPSEQIDVDVFVDEWLSLAEVGERLGLQIGRVKQLVRERQLLAVPGAGGGGGPAVPAAFVDGNRLRKGLHGTLTLLHDAGYDDRESLRWLFSEDDALRETPMRALIANRPKDVHRVAQILGF